VLPWQDVLHEGPVPDVSRAELLRVRAAFMSACGWGRRSTIQSALERRDRQFRKALRDGRRVVLWFEHDLYDQLQLLDALALAEGFEGSLESIVVGSFLGKPSFRGLGELQPDELETLWPARQEVTAETLAEAGAAWQAFRAPEPVALAELALERLPFLGAALERLLEELPAVEDGLSRTERQTLQVVAEKELTPLGAFLATQNLEEAPFHVEDFHVTTERDDSTWTRRAETAWRPRSDRGELVGGAQDGMTYNLGTRDVVPAIHAYDPGQRPTWRQDSMLETGVVTTRILTYHLSGWNLRSRSWVYTLEKP
jgi:hypothetical protein